MKTLVTGGAGFVGSHLVETLLDKGHEVIAWDNFSTGRIENLAHVQDNPNLQVREIDIATSSELEIPQATDWVFHLAALADIVPSIQNADSYFRSNVVGTFNLLQAVKDQDVAKLVYAASSSCYGIPEEYPTPESAPCHPQYPYALTKMMGEEMVMHWCQVYKVPAISLRLFNVYGPRSRTSGTYGAVFGVFLAQKLAGQPFTVVGDGSQTRDFTYVSDVARGFLAAAQSGANQEIINIGSGHTYAVNELVRALEGPVTYIPKRPGEPDCTFADVTKAKELLSWQAKVGLEQGVERILREIEYWRDAPVWTPETIQEATRDWFKYLK